MKDLKEGNVMDKWVCGVCGYIHQGDAPPEVCPQCKKPKDVFHKK
jgi:rubrerythrin